MSRYRKIDVRMFGDEAFRVLSPPAPCGQSLFIYLLTGPHTTNIPGLFSAGEAGLAEALGWPLKGFREAFAEACRKPLVKADWHARLCWIPNAIKFNKPESPNVVLSWRVTWDELPECDLKHEAYQHLKAFLEGMGKGFAKGFEEACRKPSAKAMPKPMANQEQDQDQEQEHEQEREGDAAAAPPDSLPSSVEKEEGKTPESKNSTSMSQVQRTVVQGSLKGGSHLVKPNTMSLSERRGLEMVYAAYDAPHRRGKKEEVMKAWQQLEHLPVEERPTIAIILAGIKCYRQSKDWADGFILSLPNWLNQGGWKQKWPPADPTKYCQNSLDGRLCMQKAYKVDRQRWKTNTALASMCKPCWENWRKTQPMAGQCVIT